MKRRIQADRVPSPGEPVSPDSFVLAAGRLDAQRPIRSQRLQKIVSHLLNNDVERAELELGEHLTRFPDDADAIGLMARTKVRRGRVREAVSLLARCLELAPDFAAARYNYASLLSQLNEFDAALSELERLLFEDGHNPLFLQMKADILETVGEGRQALAIFEQLAHEDPGHPESQVNYGHGLRAVGFQEKSIVAYRKAIAIRPSFGLAYWSLADMKTVRFNDVDIGAMQEQLKRTDIAADDRITLQFALGKAYEDSGAYEKSFELYAKANAAMRLRIDFNPDTVTARVAQYKALFAPEFLESRSNTGCKAPDPIFVLGQPRSGSTLIEQILSSHAAVEGTAELPYIPALAEQLEGADAGADYPRVLGKLDALALAALGEDYLRKTSLHRKLDRRYFIDKKPTNCLHVGMIHLILPNAKIIDARRHPAASCLSQFKHYFTKVHPRLSELGRVYRDYVELLAHFDRVLPGRIHRVIYEDLVADPEAEIRRLLAYLGLPFEASCLRFYETERTVLTPSSEQVRKPISAEAVDHWRHFEPWLGPLIKSLGSVFTDYPSVPEELR